MDRRIMLAAALAALGVAGYFAVRATGTDLRQPAAQPAPADDIASFTSNTCDGRAGHVCEAADHHGGYTYTPHRYPRSTGGEITAVIHNGFSPMRVPNQRDVQWIIAPPSEVMY